MIGGERAPLPQDLVAILDGLPIGIFVLAGNGTPMYANRAAQQLLGDSPDPSIGPEQLAGRYRAVVAGTDEPYPSERMPIVRALAGFTSAVEDMEIDRPGRRVAVDVWAAPVLAPDASVAYAVAAFQDVSRRRQAEADAARLHAETERQTRWLSAVSDVLFFVLSGAGLDDALDLVAAEARGLIDGDSTSIGVPDDEGVLRIGAADGVHADALRGQRLSTSDSIMGEVIAMGAAAILDDASSHGTLADPVVRLDLGPAVFVPVSAEGRAFGSLCVARRRGGELFSEEEVSAAEAFAHQAAIAVQIGQAQRKLAHLAVARDRERRAADLRERVAASLDSLNEHLAALQGARGDGGRREPVEQAVEAIERVVGELRSAVEAAPGDPPARSELERALLDLAEEFETGAGIVTVVDVRIDEVVVARLGPRAADLLELARHALAAVRGRTGARTCWIEVATSPEGTVLCVEDDGQETGSQASGDHGPALVEVAEAMGAVCEVRTTSGRGTAVRFVLAGT